ncbi:sulfotransferase [bacterium]|nr:sulfotransferase [Akkermansiaceae bacterium]MDB4488222.1 sulfotransferase [bacterium]MDB4541900.1 sulfotransferase [bacterium]
MSELSPIVVVSSSPRAGSTLLQRLLCSSENTLIYGDTVGQEVEYQVSYAVTRCQMLNQHVSHMQGMRQGVIEGRDDEFISSLIPEKGRYVKALQQSALSWLGVCHADAMDAGRELWGWKLAGVQAFALEQIAKWMPLAKFVTLERNLEDAVKSAKAVGLIACDEGLKHFCQQWLSGRQVFSSLSVSDPDRVISFNYDSMIAQPAETVALLEAFTGARNIREDVFSRKINAAFTDSPKAPAVLTAHEQDVVRSYMNIKPSQVA